MLTSAVSQRVESLVQRCNNVSYKQRFFENGLTPEDVQQSMLLRIMERIEQDPNRAEQTDGYLVQDAYMNAGLRKIAAEQVYEKYVGELTPYSVNGLSNHPRDDWQETEFEIAELVPVTETPEMIAEQDETIDALMTAIRQLSASNQRVVALLYLGHSESEIARELGVSRPAVTQRKKSIANIFRQYGFI